MKDRSDLPPEVRAMMGMFDLLDKALKPRPTTINCHRCGALIPRTDVSDLCLSCLAGRDCGVRIQ